jgi:predicted nuclease of predicted toxin-antitoxin system
MRLLIDMNLTPRWVQCLARAGHESVHWSELGPASAPDTAICEYARERAFVLVTNDMDFPQILAHTAEAKPSVILLRGEPLVPELRGSSLLNAIADCADDLEAGAILSLDWSGKPRARLLPLRYTGKRRGRDRSGSE